MVNLSNMAPQKLVYKYHDFHSECKKNTDPMLHLIDTDLFPNYIKGMGIFSMTNTVRDLVSANGSIEEVSTKITQKQKGLVRTNCVDCLDRTGIAQHKVCEKVMRELIPEIKAGQLGASWDADLTFLWAYGGDYISKEYSGTNSVLTKIVL